MADATTSFIISATYNNNGESFTQYLKLSKTGRLGATTNRAKAQAFTRLEAQAMRLRRIEGDAKYGYTPGVDGYSVEVIPA